MAEHNWPDLTRRFVAREWPSLPAMSKGTGISIHTLKNQCKALAWLQKRSEHDAKVDAKAMRITVTSQAQQVSKVKAGWVSLAQKFRAKLLQAMSKKIELTPTEMIRMAVVIQQLESKAYNIGGGGIRGVADVDEDAGMVVNNTQINLNAAAVTDKPPALALDFNDEQLIKLLGPKVVDAGMARASQGTDAKPSGGRAAKKKSGKK